MVALTAGKDFQLQTKCVKEFIYPLGRHAPGDFYLGILAEAPPVTYESNVLIRIKVQYAEL